ncbi:MAG: glycosyltransferase family 9 protein [Bdellovibrionales bacterium]|nr:glycosyltransferase family 9 protein [Bdellovibrionales bacterium]
MLIVHLEALGAVLRATSLLPAIKRKYPHSHVTWVTKAPAHHLLNNIPHIDKVFTISPEDLLQLNTLRFDFGFCIDKSLKAAGVLANTNINNLKGFTANSLGKIVPANNEAQELWELGLSNHKKFFVNKKPETQLLIESLDLGSYQKDPYQVFLTPEEQGLASRRKNQWSPNGECIVGINTGCSPTIPYKKLSINMHRQLITYLNRIKGIQVVLLGGPEDTERNSLIAKDLNVISSPTEKGLRDGLVSVAACDTVITGDSLGMHMAIGLEKHVIAWFGPTCSQEIELYGRGVKIITAASCAPCWSRECNKSPMCYDLVSAEKIIVEVQNFVEKYYKDNLPDSLSEKILSY